jgi:hypothetical protein
MGGRGEQSRRSGGVVGWCVVDMEGKVADLMEP